MAVMDKVKKLFSRGEVEIARKRDEEGKDQDVAAKLAFERDSTNAQIRSVIAQLQAKGIDTAGLAEVTGGNVRTSSDAAAQANAAASMESAASGKLLVTQLGELVAPALPIAGGGKSTGLGIG